MTTIVAIVGLFALQLVTIALLKAYKDLPQRELKRRAVKGDEVADLLFRVSSYGLAAQYVLWILAGLVSSGLFLLVSRTFNGVLAYIIVALSIWVGYVWLPARKVSGLARRFAVLLSPMYARVLSILHPITKRLTKFLSGPLHVHTGLYQKDDLIELLERQKGQTDSRISNEEIDIIEHALQFGDRLIRDVMTPRSVVSMVYVDEAISTYFLNELHKKGHSRLPVYDTSSDDLVGVLYMRDLVGAKESGTVRTVMNRDVFYVNEEQPLMHALNAFLKTQHHLFIVVNSFEEFVGIITIEDVIEQIIGSQIVDEFDQYDNMRAVAMLTAEKQKAQRPGKNTEEIVE